MTTLQIQCLLTYLGYPVDVDGIIGAQTKSAIMDFQWENELTADGICGEQTSKKLIQNVVDGKFRKNVANTTSETQKNVAVVPSANAGNTGTFWDNIKYFSREEFRCPCGKCNGFPAEPVEKLVRIADAVRAKAGNRAHVSSGVRCVAHNNELPNASKTSRHLKGCAMDFCIDGMSSTQLDAIVGAQIGVAYHYKIDDRFVHMDVVL